MAGFLDTVTEAIHHAETNFITEAHLMRSTIDSAGSDALAAHATHQGPSSTAFQATHARFVESAARVNMLLDIAQANLGDNANTYVAADANAAAGYTGF
jgi:uncharacterized protein YukE